MTWTMESYLQASSRLYIYLIVFSCCLGQLFVLAAEPFHDSNSNPLKVVYAVNAGGDEHTDRNGIHYEADPLRNVGIASDYGKHLLMIGRVQEQDEVLYRTERYHTTTFGYDFPADGDGDYALIMKFCEVYFDAPNRKVFDVLLNRKHTVVKQLDIYDQVGRGSAHDEIVYFKISNGRLHYEGETSDVRNGKLRLDFIKGALDNPKINAFALLKGDISQVARLHGTEASERTSGPINRDGNAKFRANQHQQKDRVVRSQKDLSSKTNVDEDDEYDDDEDLDDLEPEERQQHQHDESEDSLHQHQHHHQQQQQQQQHQHHSNGNSKRPISGPRQPNPYSMDDSSILLPVFIAIGAFIPLLFCLCKL